MTDDPVVDAAPAVAIPGSARLPQATETVDTPIPQSMHQIPLHPALCLPDGKTPAFNIGEMLPWKGIYFQVQAVEGMGVVLIAHSRIQKKDRKRD